MKVQMQLEQAQKTIEEKDKRIAELEQLVKQLSASSGTRPSNNGGDTYGDENATQQYHQQYYDETAITQNNQVRLQNNIMQADTDKDLNERDEFTAEE